jgi:FAD/FMN-containing dehydrogenase
MPDATRTSKLDVDALARRVRGAVLTPGSEQYDQGCTGFQLGQPHRPAVVVEATGAQDVRAALEFAADAGARVAVQATGHGRTTALEGGVLINTRRMSGVHVDARTRTARVEAGASWQQVIEAAAPHGLAPLSGSFPGVGAVGYTLGGGVGLLARRHGFAADHVRRFELATVDGSLREVTPDGEPELFWGLRGGAATSAWSPEWRSSWCRSPASTAARCSSTSPRCPTCWKPGGSGRAPRRRR